VLSPDFIYIISISTRRFLYPGAFNNRQSIGGPDAAAQEANIPDDKVEKRFTLIDCGPWDGQGKLKTRFFP